MKHVLGPRSAPPSFPRPAFLGWATVLALSSVLSCGNKPPADEGSEEEGGTSGNPSGGKGGSGKGGAGGTKSGGAGGKSMSGSGGTPATGGTPGGGAGGQQPGTGGSASGGSPADASTPDAPAADTAPASGMGCGSVAGAKFCDDFEGAAMAGEYSLGNGITVDATRARSGTKSIHFQPKGTSYLSFTKQFPMNDMHGRMMLYMLKTPPTNSHWNFLISDSGAGTQWSIGGMYGNFELVCDPPDNGIDSKTKFPDAKWVCLQWQFKFDPNGNKTLFHTQVDGVTVDGGMIMGPKGNDWRAGPWKNLKIGWEVFGSGAPPEFWVDDLAFGDQPIACPTP